MAPQLPPSGDGRAKPITLSPQDSALFIRRPKSTQEVVVETPGGDLVRVHVFLANDHPVLVIQCPAGPARFTLNDAGADMLHAHATERAREFIKQHRRDRHARVIAAKADRDWSASSRTEVLCAGT
jgi:hypothetical protein